jgi:hypothetical protein
MPKYNVLVQATYIDYQTFPIEAITPEAAEQMAIRQYARYSQCKISTPELAVMVTEAVDSPRSVARENVCITI